MGCVMKTEFNLEDIYKLAGYKKGAYIYTDDGEEKEETPHSKFVDALDKLFEYFAKNTYQTLVNSKDKMILNNEGLSLFNSVRDKAISGGKGTGVWREREKEKRISKKLKNVNKRKPTKSKNASSTAQTVFTANEAFLLASLLFVVYEKTTAEAKTLKKILWLNDKNVSEVGDIVNRLQLVYKAIIRAYNPVDDTVGDIEIKQEQEINFKSLFAPTLNENGLVDKNLAKQNVQRLGAFIDGTMDIKSSSELQPLNHKLLLQIFRVIGTHIELINNKMYIKKRIDDSITTLDAVKQALEDKNLNENIVRFISINMLQMTEFTDAINKCLSSNKVSNKT